jgi:hypothetical protein
MAGDNLNVWYDPEGDHLEIVFDQKAGYFEDTSLENVMRKRDAEGNLLAISIFNLSSFAGTRPRPESTSGYGLWVVFNLDVDDGATFDFDVALGYERLGETQEETDPESTSLSFARADQCARCSVFFHAHKSSPRLVERTLEIIHKPTSPPVVSIGEDPLSPVSLTSLCRDQLALALRLFQPQSFLMFPRERRREGRGRAYLALAAHQAGAPAPYVLRGRQVTRFLEFARKLHAFHVDRNLYRCIRRDPLGPEWLAKMTPDDPAGAKFFKRVARLMIATDLFEQANEAHALSGEMRLMWLVMAAEALFADDDKSELSYRLATRMAFLNGAGVEDVKRHWELVRSMYEARNKLMHGTAYVGKLSKRLPGLVGDAGFIEPTPERLLAFNNLVRASILYFIALQDSERRDVLEILDRSVFDPSEVARLRRMANEYWGLTGREDEMLCSGRWAA